MANEFTKLASVGNVPSGNAMQSTASELRVKALTKVAVAVIAKIDHAMEGYFNEVATVRSRKPMACDGVQPLSERRY